MALYTYYLWYFDRQKKNLFLPDRDASTFFGFQWPVPEAEIDSKSQPAHSESDPDSRSELTGSGHESLNSDSEPRRPNLEPRQPKSLSLRHGFSARLADLTTLAKTYSRERSVVLRAAMRTHRSRRSIETGMAPTGQSD